MNRIVIEEEDRYSICSFDSVSTNGRLLDRLDFDDDVEEVEDDFDYRGELQSVISNEDGWDVLQQNLGGPAKGLEDPAKDPNRLLLRPAGTSANQNRGPSPVIPTRSTDRPVGSFTRISGRIVDGGTRSHMMERNGNGMNERNGNGNKDFIYTRDQVNPRGVNDMRQPGRDQGFNRQPGYRGRDQENLPNGNNQNRIFNNSNNNSPNIGKSHSFGNQNHLRNDMTPPLNRLNSTMDPSINRGAPPNINRTRRNTASGFPDSQQVQSGYPNMNTTNTHFSPINKINNNPHQVAPPNPIHGSYSDGNRPVSNDSASSPFSRIHHPSQNKIAIQDNPSVDSFQAGVVTTKPLTVPRPKKIVLDESDLPSKGSLEKHNQLDIQPRPTADHSPGVQRISRNPSRKSADSVNPIAAKPSTPKRSLSHDSNINQPSQLASNKLHEDMTPDSRTKLALQFRNIGKHRDASYQLQIAANPPYNYPKAMYLYSIALKQGQGVKKNDRQYLKWLSKCILLFFNPIGLSDIVDKLNGLEPEDLIKLIIRKLNFDTKKDPVNNGEDPFELYKNLGKLSKTDILKIANTSKSQSDILALAYHELGNATMNGWGLSTKSEMVGIKLLGKSAAMGYTTSMVQLGEIWSNKSKSHKRDLNTAAAWLRLSELFGVKEIGNSWIYKEKYLVPAKK